MEAGEGTLCSSGMWKPGWSPRTWESWAEPQTHTRRREGKTMTFRFWTLCLWVTQGTEMLQAQHLPQLCSSIQHLTTSPTVSEMTVLDELWPIVTIVFWQVLLFSPLSPPHFTWGKTEMGKKTLKSMSIQTENLLCLPTWNINYSCYSCSQTCRQKGIVSWISWWDTTNAALSHRQLTPAPVGMASSSDNSPTLTPPGMGRTNSALTDSVTQAATKSGREWGHLTFISVSKGLQGKAAPAEAERLPCAHTAMRPFWCHTHSGTDDGKSGCGEKLSGFDGLSERYFKAEENVQIIKRPISVMHFKMAIIHLMPKKKKGWKDSKNNKKDALAYNCTVFSTKSVALFLPALSWIFHSCKALKLQTGFSAVILSVAYYSSRSMMKGWNILKFAHLNNTRDKNKL